MLNIGLYEPQIPPNTGNIARLAVGLDIPLFIIGKKGFSLDEKSVRRAGLDYWQHLKLAEYTDLDSFTTSNPDSRLILATTKGINPYYNFTYQRGDTLLFGSETSGLPKDFIKANIEHTITIPMPGKVRSLNLSNSVSIVIYHALYSLGFFKDFEKNTNYYTEL